MPSVPFSKHTVSVCAVCGHPSLINGSMDWWPCPKMAISWYIIQLLITLLKYPMLAHFIYVICHSILSWHIWESGGDQKNATWHSTTSHMPSALSRDLTQPLRLLRPRELEKQSSVSLAGTFLQWSSSKLITLSLHHSSWYTYSSNNNWDIL